MATGLETYYIDHNAYPTGRLLSDFTEKKDKIQELGGLNLYAVNPGTGKALYGLTTPVAYLTSLFKDPFTRPLCTKPRFYYSGRYFTHSTHWGSIVPFAYHSDDNGWILISPGPDSDYDINPATDYNSKISQPSDRILLKAYDGTNGTVSDGDIFRVKQ
jgi:hypothetical protein